jgi:hypothetical protein
MDEETARLVERYGLDRQAREIHHRVMHESLIRGLCRDIEREDKSYLAKFLKKRAYSTPYPCYASSAESRQWYCNREEAEVEYLQNILNTWNLKEKNKHRVAGLAAYKLVHSNYSRNFTKGFSAQEFLELVYSRELAQEIIREWQHWIDYRFDNNNDI